jgi:hypothetical protein
MFLCAVLVAVHLAMCPAMALEEVELAPFMTELHAESPVFSDVFVRRPGKLYFIAQRYNDVHFNYKELRFSVVDAAWHTDRWKAVEERTTEWHVNKMVESVKSESCIVGIVDMREYVASLPPGQASVRIKAWYKDTAAFEQNVALLPGTEESEAQGTAVPGYSYLSVFSLVDPALSYDQLEAWAVYHARIGVDHFELYFQGTLRGPRSKGLVRASTGQSEGESAWASFQRLSATLGGNVSVSVAQWTLPFWGAPRHSSAALHGATAAAAARASVSAVSITNANANADVDADAEASILPCGQAPGTECFHTSQVMAQQSALYRRRFRSEWIAYVDTDEFMVVHPHFKSLAHQLRSYRRAAISHAVLWNAYFVLVPSGHPLVQHKNGSTNVVATLSQATLSSSDVVREGDIVRFQNRPKNIVNTDNTVLVGVHGVHIAKDGTGMQGTKSYVLHHARPKKVGGLGVISTRVRTSFQTLLRLPRRDGHHLAGAPPATRVKKEAAKGKVEAETETLGALGRFEEGMERKRHEETLRNRAGAQANLGYFVPPQSLTTGDMPPPVRDSGSLPRALQLAAVGLAGYFLLLACRRYWGWAGSGSGSDSGSGEKRVKSPFAESSTKMRATKDRDQEKEKKKGKGKEKKIRKAIEPP